MRNLNSKCHQELQEKPKKDKTVPKVAESLILNYLGSVNQNQLKPRLTLTPLTTIIFSYDILLSIAILLSLELIQLLKA